MLGDELSIKDVNCNEGSMDPEYSSSKKQKGLTCILLIVSYKSSSPKGPPAPRTK